MSRCHYRRTYVTERGGSTHALAHATVKLYRHGTATLVTGVFSAESGGVALNSGSSWITTNAVGVAEAWLSSGETVDVQVTDAEGALANTETIGVYPSPEDLLVGEGGTGITARWVGVSRGGQLTPERGQLRAYIDEGNWTIVKELLSVGTGPLGKPLITNMRVNELSVWNSIDDRLQLLDTEGHYAETTVFDRPGIVAPAFITWDIVQVGDVVPGADLLLSVKLVATTEALDPDQITPPLPEGSDL